MAGGILLKEPYKTYHCGAEVATMTLATRRRASGEAKLIAA
jgi:hypothetical protein